MMNMSFKDFEESLSSTTTMLRPQIARVGLAFKSSRRGLQTLPMLSHQDHFQTKGIDNFMSPPAFDLAWTQYQTHMLDGLNKILTRTGSPDASRETKTIAIKYARDPAHAATFNYASMAHNNHFFFQTLSPRKVKMSDRLKQELEASFNSIETLRTEMIVTAASMFGPGFVWLVRNKSKTGGSKFSLLTTYLAGSPYSGAHWRRQTTDMNTEPGDDTNSKLARGATFGRVVNTVGAHGQHSEIEMAPGGIDCNPVLCLNTWEHCYLPDYGIFGREGRGGKREYAEAWWEQINWEIVEKNSDLAISGRDKYER
ncbi:Fe superoxide dismutase [Bisporella sp. PMI_857]|nr:Fe superoxide dismutase [Bisporella sp. PMI_857]